jgi:hypothetical protein
MTLMPIAWKPDDKKLAEFSEAGLFFLGMVASPLALMRGQMVLATILWISAVVLRIVGLTAPRRLRLVFLAATIAAWPIGWVVSHAVLGVIYYGVVTPIGLAFRLTGRRPLALRPDPKAGSHWERYDPNRGLGQYLRQY